MPQRVNSEHEERLRGEMRRLLEEYKTADTAEKAELRQRIDGLQEHIDSDKKAKEEKEKAEGTGGTMVLPPEQAPQGQHHGDKEGEPAPHQTPEHRDDKKPFWKRAW